MAKTVYTDGKSVTSSYGYYRGALRVSVSTSATKYTISVNAYTQMYGAALYGVQTILTGAASGKASGYTSSAASSYTNVPDTVVSKSVSVTRDRDNHNITFTVKSKGVSVSGVGAADGETDIRSYTVTVPKLDSYTVKFNANGGTGSMASLTKWYGESLRLSQNTFTRTGYTFQGWATSASGDVKYRDGAYYTSNAAVTLYAVWQKESATETAPRIVSFDAVRTDASKVPSENGEYAVISYVVEQGILNGSEVEPVITVTYQDGSQTETAQPDTAIEIGQVAKVFTLTARNTGGQLTVTSLATVPAIFYTMDFLAGGKGIGVGGRAVAGSSDKGLLTVDMDADFVGEATAITQPTTDNSTKIATTAFVQAVAAGGGTVPVPYDFAPEMDGVASAGTGTAYARGNHVHPSDTSRVVLSDTIPDSYIEAL